MQFFVFGATGLTGREVVRQLAQRGQSVTAHIRPDSRRYEQWNNYFSHLGVTVSSADWQQEAVERALEESSPECVFCLVDQIRGGDVDPTLLALEAAAATGRSPRFVVLSCYRSPSATEATIRRSTLPWIIARPAAITGERDELRPLEWAGTRGLDAVLRLGGTLGLSRLRDRYRSIGHRRLASALLDLALDPESTFACFDPSELRARSR